MQQRVCEYFTIFISSSPPPPVKKYLETPSICIYFCVSRWPLGGFGRQTGRAHIGYIQSNRRLLLGYVSSKRQPFFRFYLNTYALLRAAITHFRRRGANKSTVSRRTSEINRVENRSDSTTRVRLIVGNSDNIAGHAQR